MRCISLQFVKISKIKTSEMYIYCCDSYGLCRRSYEWLWFAWTMALGRIHYSCDTRAHKITEQALVNKFSGQKALWWTNALEDSAFQLFVVLSTQNWGSFTNMTLWPSRYTQAPVKIKRLTMSKRIRPYRENGESFPESCFICFIRYTNN